MKRGKTNFLEIGNFWEADCETNFCLVGLAKEEEEGKEERKGENKSSKDRTWSAVLDALLGVIAEEVE